MLRKNTTPAAVPRTAEVIQLSSRRKPEAGKIKVRQPEGALPQDRFEAFPAKECPELKPKSTALLICYLTDDVKDGDIAAVRVRNETPIGRIRFSGVWIELGEGDYQETYHQSKVEVLGRIVEMQIGDERIAPRSLFRPVREKAKIYQFRRAS